MDMKRFFLYFITIAALALAGCGGNGGGSSQSSGMDDMMGGNGNGNGADTMPLAAVAMALGLPADADEAAVLAAIEAKDPEDAVVAHLRTALELEPEATPAMIVATVMQLQMDLSDANDRLADLVETERTQMQMAKVNKAKAYAEAIDGNKVVATENGLGSVPSPAPLTVDATNFKVERGTDGMVEVEVTPSATGSEKFEGEETGGDPWTHLTLTRSPSRNVNETLKLITDIGEPTSKEIGKELTQGGLTIEGAAGRAFVMPTTEPTGSASLTYAENAKFEGTYRGIDGTYECTSSGCTISLDADDKIMVGESDVFTFVPNSVSATYNDPDTSYMVFGAWIKETKETDGTYAYMIAPYQGAVGITEATGRSISRDLVGSAKYVGEAAGAFVTKTFTAGDLTDANQGIFAAVATLTADFDAGEGGGTIEGTIDNFMVNNDNVNPSGWEVTLEETALDGTANFSGMTDVSYGGAAVEDAGVYQGTFYGNAPVTVTADTKAYPGMVGGTFDAHIPAAHLSGGFGAHKE